MLFFSTAVKNLAGGMSCSNHANSNEWDCLSFQCNYTLKRGIITTSVTDFDKPCYSAASGYPLVIQFVFRLTGKFRSFTLVNPDFVSSVKAGRMFGHLGKGQHPQ
jgi:hypothetical protein